LIISCVAIFSANQIRAVGTANESYEVQANNVLEIIVAGNEDLHKFVTVSSDGTITFPYIGSLSVRGKKVSEIEEEITKKLSEGYIKYPVVSISLIKSTTEKIFAYGLFNMRGDIPYVDDMTVLKAMSLAGGVSIDALYGKLLIKRLEKGKHNQYQNIIEAKLIDGVIESRKVQDMLLEPNDVLIVERSKTFLIQGEVAKRGRFILEEDMKVLRALLEAGGVSTEGMYGKIKVRRKQEGVAGGYKDLVESNLNEGVIESNEVEDTILEPDDILIVERGKTFLIQGEVAKRGRFILEEDMKVLRALLEAGGVSTEGMYGKIKVRRKQEGVAGGYKDLVESNLNEGVIESKEVEDTILQPDDILIIERGKTFLIQGEVAKRGRFILEKDMKVLRALLEAGGVSNDGMYSKIKVRRKQEGVAGGYKDLVESNLNEGVIESKEVEDTILEPDDILIVERNKTFLIYGEVMKTGEFVFKNDMTVFKALTIAGGFTKWGSASRVKILRPKNNSTGFESIKVNIDKVLKGDASADMLIEPGDTIVVSSGVF
jgi:polysaccharide export outer membrane protein